MVNSAQTISQFVWSSGKEDDGIWLVTAINTPPWLCPFLFGGLSFLKTVLFSGEKYSDEGTEESNHVSVLIIMSGWSLSKRISKSGFLFLMDRNFMLTIFSGQLLLNRLWLLQGSVVVGVWLFSMCLWIGEDVAFVTPGLVNSSKEEKEFCETDVPEVVL